MEPIEQAWDVYRRSGKANWLLLPPGFSLAMIAAVVMAFGLFVAFVFGFYLIFLAPMIAAAVVGGAWHLVLRVSHCRNQTIATAGGVILGMVVYLGYFHFGLLQFVGLRNAHRVDLLPTYVQFRMATDVVRKVGAPDRAGANLRGPNRVQQALNWFAFVGELLATTGVVVALGRSRVSKAYCESCRKWMAVETRKMAPGEGATLWQALQQGDYAAVHRQVNGPTNPTLNASLMLEHCPSCPSRERSSPVYLTVNDRLAPDTPQPIGRRLGALLKPRHSAGVTMIARQVALNPAEIGAIAGSFSGLKQTTASYPSLYAESHATAKELEQAAAVVEERLPSVGPTTRLARIEDVDPHEAKTVLTRKNAIFQTIIGLGSGLGGLMLAIGLPVVFLSRTPKPPDWLLILVLVWLFGLRAFNVFWNLFFARYPTSRFMRGQTRRSFEYRTNPAVDLHDPEIVFVDIIPRQNWGKMMMENASDIGFVEINHRRRELIFEGDCQRYWIPAESILSIKHESWAEPVQHQFQTSPTLNHLIVVRAMTADGPWETWFYQRQNHFRMHTKKRRLADAIELQSRILEWKDGAAGTSRS